MSRVEDFYPLSPMQEGMLFHTLCAPDSGVYVTQVSIALPGEVDIAAFERSWRLVAGRHPALRTFFAWEGLESPVQVVEREVELPVAQHDWRDLSATACGERLAAFLASERACGFDLSQAPLLRLCLIRLASGLWQMVWTFHHLILDGWSVSLVLGEVAAAYESLSRCCEPDLVPARPYRDYIVWLRRQDLALAEEHWRRVLRGFTSPTPLPPDPDPAQLPDGRPRAAAQQVRLSAAATTALTAAGRRAGVTLNTLVQGAWAVLLSRYSGQSDVVFGAAVLGRPADLPGANSIVGLFINTLLVRVDAATDAAVGAWLQQLQASWAQARRYEHSPLVQVQGWSEVPRGVPLFESIVVFGGSPRDAGVQHRGESRPAPTRGWALETMDQTNVPLNLEVTPGAELGLEIRYAPARFGEGFVRRMLGHLTTVLAELPADLDRRISDLPLLTAAEREQLLDVWNHTEVALPREGCAHRLFEVRAAQAPDAVALGWGEEELTYGQLNRRANGVAAALLERGIGGDDVVPLLGRRGPDLAAAILGVWKAGGAYLPLDPRHPAERLLHILEQSAPPLAIVAGELEPIFQQTCEGLPPARRPASLRLERLAGRELEGDPAPRGDPRDLAYVIYTSGSTGLPKGVMIEHLGMLNHLLAKVRTLGLGSADCVAQTAAITFDISVWQLMAALLVGGRVRIVGDEVAADPLRLLGEVERFGVTVLQTVPSMLQAMVERLEAAPRRPALISLV
ncbi:MAG TPA: condensation domain-containing protein, partial [Thermoanaerobaculia bacterium]|nr:condensation domain-containing protein [Thermoanaerobaculia bacterium]